MSTNCIEPRGNTLSPKNPRRGVLTGSSFSFPIPILSKADSKMISAEPRCRLAPDEPFCWPQLRELPVGHHEGVGIPLDLSQRT